MEPRARRRWKATLAFAATVAFGVLLHLATRAPRERAPARDARASGGAAGAAAADTASRPIEARDADSARELESREASRPAAMTLRVRSAHGIPLPYVDVVDRGAPAARSWRRVQLDGDLARLEAAPSSLEKLVVSAPGHRPASPPPGRDEVVLEGDDVLVLRAPGLRAATSRVASVLGRFGGIEGSYFEGACSYGFVDADTWAIASDSGRFAAALRGELDVRLDLKSRTWINVERVVQAFRHDEYALALGEAAAPSTLVPLEIRVALESKAAPLGPVRGRLVGRESHTELLRSAVTTSWGVVQIYVASVDEPIVIDAGRDTCTIAAVPIGLPCVVGARDAATGAFGRARFTHDGTPRVVVLQRPTFVRGRLLADDTRPLPATVTLLHRFPSDSVAEVVARDDVFWALDRHALSVGPDGSFAMTLPESVPVIDRPIDVPKTGVLVFEVPGYEPPSVQVRLESGTAVDLGVITLHALRPDLVLAPGHGLEKARLPYTYVYVPNADPSTAVEIRDGRLRDDGSLDLFFTLGYPRPASLGELIVWSPDASDGHPFRARADGSGVYEAITTRTYEIGCLMRLDRPTEVTWRWKGFSFVLDTLAPSETGHARVFRFVAPAEGASLAWRTAATDGAPAIDAVEGTTPLAEERMTVEIAANGK